jgi:hypothetical protein
VIILGKAKITVTGTPTKEPKIKQDGTVDLLIKVDMSNAVPKGLESLGASICLVHVGKKTWKKVSSVATKESFYIVQGEVKANVSKKNTPFMEIIAFDISLKEAMPPKETKKQEKKEVKQEKTPAEKKEEPKKIVPKEQSKQDKPENKKNHKKSGHYRKRKTFAYISEWFKEDEIITVNTNDVVVDDPSHIEAYEIRFGKEFLAKVHEAKKIIKPVAVRKTENDKYVLVMGFKIFISAKIFNIETIPVVIKDMTAKEFEDKYVSFQDWNTFKENLEKDKEREKLKNKN